MARAKLTTPRAAFIIIMAAGAFFARATCAYATYYVPDVMFIKFNQDVTPEVVEGIVQMGINSVDGLNETYGVYDFEQLFPLPEDPIEHPDGLWDWDDYTAAYDEFKLGRIYVFKFPAAYKNVPGAVGAYNELPEVEYAHLDEYGTLHAKPNDPQYVNRNQWHLYKIQAAGAWDYTKGGGIKIAVIDTGIEDEHPDLDAKVVAGYDFVEGDDDPQDECDMTHGTHVAGIAAAETDNNVGIAALGWHSDIMPLRVSIGHQLHIPPRLRAFWATQAIKWALEEGAHCINMSFGWSRSYRREPMKVLCDICGAAYKLNVLLVASSGNGGVNEVCAPACYGPVIAVGATDDKDIHWEWSNYGPELELCAPGVGILSTMRYGDGLYDYGEYSGTSMAAPLVTATAALCRAKWPTATAPQIRKIMQGFSDDLGPSGRDAWYGFGRVNPRRILARAEGKTLPEVVAEAEAEIDERLAFGARSGFYVGPGIAEAVYQP